MHLQHATNRSLFQGHHKKTYLIKRAFQRPVKNQAARRAFIFNSGSVTYILPSVANVSMCKVSL